MLLRKPTFSTISILIVTLLIAGHPFNCFGQKIYELGWKKDGFIAGAAIGIFAADLLLFDNAPITAEEINALNRDELWRIDRPATFNFSPSARTASDYFRTALTIAPLSLYLSKRLRANGAEYIAMYAETIALNLALTNIVKSSIRRIRPFIYNPEVPTERKIIRTAKRSFFSGHVSHTASMSFFTAKVFSDLHPDSGWRHAVWAGAIIAPALTGYFRYEAGRHFPSDVIVGYAVGAAIGYFIPKLHQVMDKNDISIIGAERGIGLGIRIGL